MNCDFHYVFVIFDNSYYVINDRDCDRAVDPCCDNVVGLVFSVSSISTIMAETHQRNIQDEQDRQQGQQACMVLPNVTVLIRFFNRR